MAANEKISNFQFGCLFFTYLSGFSTLFLYGAKTLQQDVWISNLLATFGAVFIVWLMKYVQTQHPAKNMTEICELLLGKWLGKAILFVILFNIVGLVVLTLRALTLFYTTAILPYTSPELIMLMLVLVTSYAVFLGLETTVRTVQVILPLFLVSIIIICLLILRNVDTNPLIPQFQSRFTDIVYGTMLSYAFPFAKSFGLVFVLFSRVANLKKIMSTCFISLMLSCVYLLISTYLAIGALGMNLMKSSTFPFFSTIQLVRIGVYLERIEIIIIGIWTIFTLYETIIAHFWFIQVFSSLFRIRDTKPFILPAGLLFFSVALNSFARPTELGIYNTAILPFSMLFPTLILPLILVILTVFKKQKGDLL
ncbi:endospore germination permease [Paenibacillus sp. GCM10023248]|uniref:GerAB/ArcD/ProY family transporter n=1 Tax=unclassified Paenibacillus TaxID=185978 RepID=UPI002377FB7E|nr:endospore germination permease [Paenibacillus sp. MAHUQ-63]MDD9268451.1 endospore germination permease [Paenibacillus sp. MAHUQ-63]